jgi:Arc/MetJ-type ribon-helix-helix transcriptional regulator
MIDAIRECQRIVRDLRAKIARSRGDQITSGTLLNDTRGVVDGYFRTDRPLFVQDLRREDLFSSMDDLMQDLLRLSQARTRKRRYLDTLASIEREWRSIELAAIPLAPKLVGPPKMTSRQETLSLTLEKICPAAAICYRQALGDLVDMSRLSWRGTATELREALREVLDTLAPDDAVKRSPGFKLEDGAKAPTMKQKTRFILRSRSWSEAARKQVEDAADVVEEKVGGFVRSVYGGSSASVHSSRDKKEALSVLRFVETCLSELLEVEGT